MWRRDSADEEVTKCHVRGEVALLGVRSKVLQAASPCGAGVAHSLGKGEATSSNLVKGKFMEKGEAFKNSQMKIEYG